MAIAAATQIGDQGLTLGRIATILAGATAFIAFRGTLAIPRLATTALAVMFAMLTFFLLLITTPAAMERAIAGETGTRIVPDKTPKPIQSRVIRV